ncbi:YbaB/EbfC family nucleoid-associated protein [Paractinoplanes durhamensis]|uniref:YbaB/EbfC DNA-binding family protein n=1 Tax=Paractinoplanes durhamensis TaxID=113563 RepID=A0ABQ3ZBI2_9ACTN|nr:YbaB/EbfC family nucleoid-associated protein [Actinoplanes durhamensis]GIE07177.1 hypothetical protein Adu01nite_85270 [Actinoplanes durhamensis]
MFDESASAALQRIDEWEQSLTRRAEHARKLAERAAAISATARSEDDLIEVTVGAEGQIERLHLDERTRRQPAEDTARQILETLNAAKAKMIEQFDEAVSETVGADSETGRTLVAGLRRRLGQTGQ